MSAHTDMPPLYFQRELNTAIAAARRASKLTQKIFTALQAGKTSSAGTVTKPDRSPVTIADYGSQAIIKAMIHSAFPNDQIAAEEDADELRRSPELRGKVWKLVASTLQEMPAAQLEREGGNMSSPGEMMDSIDRGNSSGHYDRNTLFNLFLILRFLDD
jgi:3'(2'), 5'-bisphosphate nucleotidase